MPKYDFQCQECGKVQTQVLPMSQCQARLVCQCGGASRRIFTADFQLTTQPVYLRPENDLRMGMSETDYNAQCRREDKEYENRKPAGPGPTRAIDL